jgi:hypothetical protein
VNHKKSKNHFGYAITKHIVRITDERCPEASQARKQADVDFSHTELKAGLIASQALLCEELSQGQHRFSSAECT